MKIEKIYVSFKAPETLREFLEKFFSVEYRDDRRTAVATWTNEICTTRQCVENKWRSVDDMMIIVNTYYPNTDVKELLHILLTLNLKTKEGRELFFHMGTCGDIQNLRMLYYEKRPAHAFTDQKYKSQYSWPEYLAMLDIKNDKELIEYTEKHKLKENNGNSEERKEESASSGGS